MPTLHKWGIPCVTEDTMKWVWTESDTIAPTTCPTDSAHEIGNDITVWDTIGDGVVKIRQETVETNNRIRSCTFCSSTVAVGETYVYTALWKKHNTNVKEVVVRGQLGDTMTLSFSKDTTVGVIPTESTSGAETLAFDMTPLTMIINGSELRLIDGTGASEYMEIGLIATDVVTLQNPLPRTFAAGSVVQIREVAATNYLMEREIVAFGKGSLIAANFPANIVCTFTYTNNGASPLLAICNVHYWR